MHTGVLQFWHRLQNKPNHCESSVCDRLLGERGWIKLYTLQHCENTASSSENIICRGQHWNLSFSHACQSWKWIDCIGSSEGCPRLHFNMFNHMTKLPICPIELHGVKIHQFLTPSLIYFFWKPDSCDILQIYHQSDAIFLICDVIKVYSGQPIHLCIIWVHAFWVCNPVLWWIL